MEEVLLTEDGENLLTETGENILLEESSGETDHIMRVSTNLTGDGTMSYEPKKIK